MKIKNSRSFGAFTLVELIVVITILAILGTIAFISLQGYSRDARDSTRLSDIGNIKTTVLGSTAGVVASSGGGGTPLHPPTLQSVSDCGTTTGNIIYGTIDGLENGLTCSDDIIVCNGTTGSGITISACNQGATEVALSDNSNKATSYGELFQWGNNAGIKIVGTSTAQIGATTSNNTYSNPTFISSPSLPSPYDWTSIPNDNLWGNTTNTNTSRIGPCLSGYHVPTQPEWNSLFTTMPGTQALFSKTNKLKLPAAGHRIWVNASLYYQGSYGYYWSSSPNGANGYNMYFYSTNIDSSTSNHRAFGFSVRCFKN